MKLILGLLIFFNFGWAISQYNDQLKANHEIEIKNEILKQQIKINYYHNFKHLKTKKHGIIKHKF